MKMEEVRVEVRGVEGREVERGGHVEKGFRVVEGGGEEKLYKGREVKPGQNNGGGQGEQVGTSPKLPQVHPTQEGLFDTVKESGWVVEKREGRRGGGQARGTQSSKVTDEAVMGCWPKGQLKGKTKHCVSSTAPVDAVVFPGGQGRHFSGRAAPGKRLKVPSLQGVGSTADGPLKVPGGVCVHMEDPGRGE